MKQLFLTIIATIFYTTYYQSYGSESSFQNKKFGFTGDYNYFRGGINLFYEHDFYKSYGIRTGFGFFDNEMLDVQVIKFNQKTLRELTSYNLNLTITNRFYPFSYDLSFFIGFRIVYPLYIPERNSKIKQELENKAKNNHDEKIHSRDEPVDFHQNNKEVINFRLDLLLGIEYETQFGLILSIQNILWLTNTLKDYHPDYPNQKIDQQKQLGQFIPSFSIGSNWIRIAHRISETDSNKITNCKFGVIIDYNFHPNAGLFYEHKINNFCGIRFGAEYSFDEFNISFLNIKGEDTVIESRNSLFNYGRRLTIDYEQYDHIIDNRNIHLNFIAHSISIPITARFYLFQSKLCIFTGMQLDIILKSYCNSNKNREENRVISGESRKHIQQEYEQIDVNKILPNGNSFTNRARLNILWGMDYETSFGLIFGFRHTIWLTKIVNLDPEYLPYKKSDFYSDPSDYTKTGITLGINIATILNLLANIAK